MTGDTRRALNIIRPLTDELGITISATDSILSIGDDKIGIACNSTWATLMEMVGWIFWEEYVHRFRRVDIDPEEVNASILRYRVKPEMLKKMGVEE